MKKFILIFLYLITTNIYAQWKPNDTVRAIIPFSPGGGTDLAFKHFQKWAEDRNIKIFPVYKGGADGLIGMEEVAKSFNDGLTISFGTVGTAATHKNNFPNYSFNHISMIRGSVMTLVTHTKSEINNIEDLEKEIRDKETIKNFAHGAPTQLLLLRQLFKHLNIKKEPTMVPYRGSGPLIQDLIGAHVDVAILPMSILKTHIESGKIRVLAISVREPWQELKMYVNLNNRYLNWKNFDGFLISLPNGVKPEVLHFWEKFIKDYISDEKVLMDFRNDFSEALIFGQKSAQEVIINIQKNK